MKTKKLIDILAREGDAVKPLLNPFLRFAIWFGLSSIFMIILFPMVVPFFQHDSAHMHDYDTANSIILLLSTVVLGYLAFVMNSPVSLNPALKFAVAGIFIGWILRTLIILFITEEAIFGQIQNMYSGRPHAGCMANNFLFFAVPFFIIIAMLRSGYTLEKTWAGFYAATASLSASELMTSLICPDTEPLHILAWHIIPIIPIPVGIWLISEKLLRR